MLNSIDLAKVLAYFIHDDGTIISNQATISGDNFADSDSDDNGDDGDGINPTIVPVNTGAAGSGGPSGLNKQVSMTTFPGTAGSNVAVGETVTFAIQVNVPEGTTRQVTLTDTLPAGLVYVPGSVRLARTFSTGLTASANPGNVNTAASGTDVALSDGGDVSVAGQLISIFLGDVINSDNDPDAEGFLVLLDAQVENVIGNQQRTNLVNQAGLRYYNGLSFIQLAPAAAGVTVVEPDL